MKRNEGTTLHRTAEAAYNSPDSRVYNIADTSCFILPIRTLASCQYVVEGSSHCVYRTLPSATMVSMTSACDGVILVLRARCILCESVQLIVRACLRMPTQLDRPIKACRVRPISLFMNCWCATAGGITRMITGPISYTAAQSSPLTARLLALFKKYVLAVYP